MANVIAIMGESGSGKTTSMRNLDPTSTYYFDCDKKGLSWKNWRNQYSVEKKNYCRTDDQSQVLAFLHNLNTKALHIKTIVIDTLNGIMVADEIRRSGEKTYDKWMDLAVSVYKIIDYALTMRDDITVICVCHSQTDRDENGYNFSSIKTNGKKLNKIGLESKFTTVLFAKCIEGNHIFEVKSKNSTAKTPMGMFDVDFIENDITIVLEKLKEY